VKIGGLIDELLREPADDCDGPWLPHQTATRELLDLILRPDTSAATIQSLTTRLAQPHLDPMARARLRAVHDWTQPMIAFEVWHHRRHWITQYLPAPSRRMKAGESDSRDFDRVNGCILHCATNAILPEGDYPLAEADAGGDPDYFWYLTYLPTARRRLIYDFLLHNRSDAERLVDMTSETLQRHIDFQRPITDFALLNQLDADTISRFSARYFAATSDTIARASILHEEPRAVGWPSRQGVFCLWLADHGSHNAIPGLIEALDRGQIYKPDKERPLNLPWLAALTIARGDPWAGEDDWLAKQIARDDELDLTAKADVGACAAALLLFRHRERPSDFGLEEVESAALEEVHFKAYRFHEPERRAAMIQWCQDQKSATPGK
jgi:hypothetical protein